MDTIDRERNRLARGMGYPSYSEAHDAARQTIDEELEERRQAELAEVGRRDNPLPCPLCGAQMHPKLVRNALSRLDNDTYICSLCGTREACAPQRNQNTRCLYRDEVMGIAVVDARFNGYTPWLPKPASTPFADGYVDAWNAKLGLTKAAAMDIVGRSMFGVDA